MDQVYAVIIGLAIIGIVITILSRLAGSRSFWAQMVDWVRGFIIATVSIWLWSAVRLPVDYPQLLWTNKQWWYPLAILLPGVILLAIFDRIVAALKKPPTPPAE